MPLIQPRARGHTPHPSTARPDIMAMIAGFLIAAGALCASVLILVLVPGQPVAAGAAGAIASSGITAAAGIFTRR